MKGSGVEYIKIRPAEASKVKGRSKGGAMVAISWDRMIMGVAVCSSLDEFVNETGRDICWKRLRRADAYSTRALSTEGRRVIFTVCAPTTVPDQRTGKYANEALKAVARVADSKRCTFMVINDKQGEEAIALGYNMRIEFIKPSVLP